MSKLLVYTCFLLFAAGQAAAQTAAAGLSKTSQPPFAGILQEKIFLHTDRTFYLAGDIIWFSMYCVEGASHKPLDVSKIAYADVLDQQNKPVLQIKIALQQGEGSGSFSLPVSLGSGSYTLRAYTSWMKNFGPEGFFQKVITIVNPLKSLPAMPPDTAGCQIDFFPEGGGLVAGLQSRVAFRALDNRHKGALCHGAVINENNDTVARFRSYLFGLGNFLFTPSGGHSYRAFVSFDGHGSISRQLPSVSESGYVMRLDAADGMISIRVQSKHWDTAGADNVYLLATNSRKAVKVESAFVNNDSALFRIPKDQLPEGISQFTLFNGAGQPLCERLYFIRPQTAMAIQAVSDAPSYRSREKITLTVAAKDKEGKAEPASLSLSVYLLDSLQQPDQTDIVSYLWLGSELKGAIESPGYYFSHDDRQAEENLVLTHGWRKFRGAGTPGRALMYVPEYSGHIVTGKIISTTTGRPGRGVQAYLSVPDLHAKFYTQKSDDSGTVKFDVKDYYGQGEIVAQTDASGTEPYRMEIASPYSEEYSDNALLPLRLEAKDLPALTDRSVSMQVQHVYAEDSMARFVAPQTDTLPFYGFPDHAYLLDNYTRFVTMEEVLREYIREIDVRNHNGHPEMIMLDEPHRAFFSGNLLVLVDGVPVFDQSKIFSFDPLRVKKLEVVTTQYFLGNYAFNGIASFSTYKGGLDGFQLDPSAVVIDYDGLQLEREFYAPAYPNEKQASSRTPDFRTVLQWSPGIRTGGKDKQISFYSSDAKGTYLVSVQGIDAAGNAGSTSFTIMIK